MANKTDKPEMDLTNAVTQSFQELHRCLDNHCCIVAAALDQGVDLRNCALPAGGCKAQAREKELKNAILLAIYELDESRKSFRSKRLENLRKKLTQVLLDQD